MYINFKVLTDHHLSYEDLVKLLYIKQAPTDKLPNLDNIEHLSKYLTTLKKGEVRLNQVGKDLLNLIEVPNAVENDLKLADYLIAKFKEDDLAVTSVKKLVGLIAWFRSEVGLTHKELLDLITDYLNSDSGKYNKKLDYMFFKPENAYSKLNLASSRLYEYFEGEYK